ncbi:MAG: DUF2974 domain-containing protein [Deltaproteobacteria bacterium]|jgi:hypothetical protein|nr:DUF2974 domain-containing protein [Deltaproteobacteria bacterium]
MPDIYDYMAWRGDLAIARDGFNEVDNLVLSAFAYVPLDGIVPADCAGAVSIGEAAREFAASPATWKLLRMRKDKRLFEEIGRCPRFAGLRLHCYANVISLPEETQFAAVTVDLGDGSHFVAYRGTDNTLVGWKEDFNMGFMRQVPAQSSAVAYLESMAARLAGPLRVGGHSKGGNLAIYASAFCAPSVRERIVAVYNNDGPWLHAEAAGQPGYLAIRDRLRAFIPQTSIIGLLLEHEERYSVVRSRQKGLFQHDFYSWEVSGPRFVHLASVTDGSRFVDHTVKAWLSECSEEQRALFVEALFRIVNATGAKTFQEMGAGWRRSALAMLKSYLALDKDTRKALGKTLGLFVKAAGRHLRAQGPAI